jgi:hypothetical protein
MRKLMLVTNPVNAEPVKLHYVPAGAMRCQYCTLSAPRMRMFYTDDPEVWSATEMCNKALFHAPLVDDQGRAVLVEACVKLPF